jgi:hypothetical protein
MAAGAIDHELGHSPGDGAKRRSSITRFWSISTDLAFFLDAIAISLPMTALISASMKPFRASLTAHARQTLLLAGASA